MDDFFAELERNITNIGSAKFWKRQIGDVTIWFSPITLTGQERVNDLLSNAETMGMNVINETKRITLSHSIVGINDIDLREFRDNVPRFPSLKDGKSAKVTLDRYVYQKMSTWSAQFIDDSFSVLADLVETDQKENLRSIKFENAKDPKTELKELESRVSELRSNMNLPPLIEAPPMKLESNIEKPDPRVAAVPSEKPVMQVDFDPFASLLTKSDNSIPPSAPIAPVASPAAVDRTIRDEKGNPVQAYLANPSSDVIESPRSPGNAPPVIDPTTINRNPRFSPTSR